MVIICYNYLVFGSPIFAVLVCRTYICLDVRSFLIWIGALVVGWEAMGAEPYYIVCLMLVVFLITIIYIFLCWWICLLPWLILYCWATFHLLVGLIFWLSLLFSFGVFLY